MVRKLIVCENCEHEFEHEFREPFEVVTCPECKEQKMTQASGRYVRPKSTLTDDPRFTAPVNKILRPG